MEGHTCHPRTWKVEARRPGVQGQSQGHTEFESGPDYTKPYLKTAMYKLNKTNPSRMQVYSKYCLRPSSGMCQRHSGNKWSPCLFSLGAGPRHHHGWEILKSPKQAQTSTVLNASEKGCSAHGGLDFVTTSTCLYELRKHGERTLLVSFPVAHSLIFWINKSFHYRHPAQNATPRT